MACARQPVNDVGEPCAGEPHARFDVAAGGNPGPVGKAVRSLDASRRPYKPQREGSLRGAGQGGGCRCRAIWRSFLSVVSSADSVAIAVASDIASGSRSD